MPVALTLVIAEDCHLCDHARAVLARLGRDVPLAVEEVGWESPLGSGLVRAAGVALPPALYSGTRLLGYGRLSERGLRRRLGALRE
jgi:hypothetical protein